MADALNTVALVGGKWKATALSEVAQSLARRKQFVRATKIADGIESLQRKQSLSSVNGNLSVESLHRDLSEHWIMRAFPFFVSQLLAGTALDAQNPERPGQRPHVVVVA